MGNDSLVFSSGDPLEVVPLELSKKRLELALSKVFLQNANELVRFVNLERVAFGAPRHNVGVVRSLGIVQHVVQPKGELGRSELVGMSNALLL
jgi:hypothetical protein